MTIEEPPRIDHLFGVSVSDWHALWIEARKRGVEVRNLLLEAKAEMPCYRVFGWGKYRGQSCLTDKQDLGARWYDTSDFELCPSCKAQEELSAAQV